MSGHFSQKNGARAESSSLPFQPSNTLTNNTGQSCFPSQSKAQGCCEQQHHTAVFGDLTNKAITTLQYFPVRGALHHPQGLVLLSRVNTQKDCPKSKGLRLGNAYSVFKTRALPFNWNICLYSLLKQQRPLWGAEIFVNFRRLSLKFQQ